jgi:hypothetical protein
MQSINDLFTSSVTTVTPTKKKNKPATTLEAHHVAKMQQFENEDKTLPELNKQLQRLQQTVSTIPSTNFDEIQRVNDNIKSLQQTIERIKSNSDKFNYFLDVGDMLFAYAEPPKTTKTSSKHIPANSILRFYAQASETKPTETETALQVRANKRPCASVVDTSIGNDRDKLLGRYLAKVDVGSLKDGMHPDAGVETGWDCCPICTMEFTVMPTESYFVCTSCGFEEFVLVDSEKPSYKESPRENTYFAYKKINHFNEWLAQFQAKDNTMISQDVIDLIMNKIRKERISDPRKLKNDKIQQILHKLKLTKLYDHTQQVKNRILQQITKLTLTKDQEEKLQHMFKEIQPSFIKYCPEDRSNFLSYPYVLYKLCQLLEMDEFLPCFQLLKQNEKLYKQDKVWEKICAEMRWQFIRSI